METASGVPRRRLWASFPIVLALGLAVLVLGSLYMWRTPPAGGSGNNAFSATAGELRAALERTNAALAEQRTLLQHIAALLPARPDAEPVPYTPVHPPSRGCEHTHFEEILWPMPRSAAAGSAVAAMVAGGSAFNFTLAHNATGPVAASQPRIIREAFARHHTRLFARASLSRGSVVGLRVVLPAEACLEEEPVPQLGEDESYTLALAKDEPQALLTAKTVWGVLRGLETWCQVVECHLGQCCVREAFQIADSPQYPWRGLHVDTARHYMPVPSLLRVVEAMEMHKMNVLHIHLSDGTAFPFVSTTFPELSAKGAYGPQQVYTPQDIATIIRTAALRGIRVLPEFDMPAHTASWGKAFPDLVLSCEAAHTERPCGPHNWAHRDGINGYCVNSPAFDPTKEALYDVLAQFFAELAERFPEKMLHLGGDELVFGCWNTPRILAFGKEHGAKTVAELQTYFWHRVAASAEAANRTLVFWEEATLAMGSLWNPPKEHVFQIWFGAQEKIRRALQTGHRIINSLVGSYYLDHPKKWTDVYGHDPMSIIPSDMRDSHKHLLLGGEVETWSERVDASNLDTTIWPIASILAERLWSPLPPPPRDPFRLESHICRLRLAGIGATPIGPGNCDPPAPF